MRLYLFLLLLASVLLAACNPEPKSGPRIDLVSSSRFLSANQLVRTPGDTFTTRVFADTGEDEEADLKRLRIRVDYTPSPYPYAYPTSGYNPDDRPKEPASIVYLDSVLTGAQARSVAFQFRAGTRTTSGREVWNFEAEDVNGRTRSRSFTLTLRNNDSARVAYHEYTILLPAPTESGARSYLSLRSGLALPPHALRQKAENQALIDLAYLPLPNGGRALAALSDERLTANNSLLSPSNWPSRRFTELRTTTLDSTGFSLAITNQALETAFAAGIAPNPATRTNPLETRGSSNRVIAFRTADPDPKTGLILVKSFLNAPAVATRLQVRITK